MLGVPRPDTPIGERESDLAIAQKLSGIYSLALELGEQDVYMLRVMHPLQLQYGVPTTIWRQGGSIPGPNAHVCSG